MARRTGVSEVAPAVAADDPRARRAGPAATSPTFAAEDALLVVWVLFGSHFVTALPGLSLEGQAGGASIGALAAMIFVQPSIGSFAYVARALGIGGWLIAGSMLFAFFTRGPDDVDLDTAILRRWLFVGPAFWLLGPLAMLLNAIGYGARHLLARLRRLDASGIQLHKGWPGLPLPPGIRRLGALPAILGGELAFRTALGNSAGEWDIADGRLGAVALTLIETMPAFVVFVAAPRIATGGTLAIWPWVLRFGLYLAAVTFGDHWLAQVLG